MILNGRVVDFVFIYSGHNWLKPMKMIGHFRNWNIGQNGFLVGHVRCPTFISTTVTCGVFEEMWKLSTNVFCEMK